MSGSQKKQCEDAARIGLTMIATDLSMKSYIRLVLPRQLNQFRCRESVQPHSMADGNPAFDHDDFFGASSSLAM